MQARRRTLAGTLGPVRTLAGTETETPGKPHLAVDGSGKATIAYDGATAADPIYARTVTPGGTVSPARRINGDG